MKKLCIPMMISLCGTLLACGSPEPRYGSVGASPMSERVSVNYARIEVTSVTLPVYAESEAIYTRDVSGAITPLGPLWADDPDRALTLEIARELKEITGQLAAPEPWPFRDLPDVRIDVRLEVFHATSFGTFRIAGMVFVAPEKYGPDRAKKFAFEVAVTEIKNPAAIAIARTAAVRELSYFIARRGLR